MECRKLRTMDGEDTRIRTRRDTDNALTGFAQDWGLVDQGWVLRDTNLTNVAFDFGPVVFKNLVITATTTANGWRGKTVSLGYSAGYVEIHINWDGNTCRVPPVPMPRKA
ncbi:hypothetical protein BDV93DRAFT_512541 [Ceratobasidium sp. AG-I]|nr:hypothetical protein BDV93DRAFT_512541 [Ceratobasidium sp. AG-I]